VFAPFTMGLQRVVPLACAVLAAVAAVQHWRDDLIDQRRRLRAFIVVTGIAYTLVTLAARVGSVGGRLSGPTATLDIAALTAIVTVVAAQMLHLAGSELFPARAGPLPPDPPAAPRTVANPQTAPSQDPAAPDPAGARLAEALRQAMAVDRLYRTEDLTVSNLAARLAVPEYRLRRLINRQLGHRNFNAYVNGFRLDDSRAALADPQQRDLPILSIALDAGFQSIGPFNRAFKAATGLTPSDFRREHLADS
jgi:AraC-like DNA-binding protein